MKKILALLLTACVLLCAFTVAASADFNASVFTSSADYSVTALDGGAMQIALNKSAISGYADASVTLNDNDIGNLTADPDILYGTDGLYVFRLVLAYTNTTVPSAQKVVITTADHRYAFTPAVSYTQAEDGKPTETMVLSLTSAATLKLVSELATAQTPAEFSIQGAAKTVSGTIAFRATEAVETMYNNYVLAGGLQQDLSAYTNQTPCDVNSIVATPGYVYDYSQYGAATTIVNSGAVAITKDPTSETVTVGGNAIFISTAVNFNYMNWRLVSPTDGSVIYMNAAPYSFNGLTVTGDGTQQLTLCNIPATLNGWMVEAVFTGSTGSVTSARATITVNEATGSYLFATPSSGYFQTVYTGVVLTSAAGERIAYTMYRDGKTLSSGTISSGETVWIEGVANENHTVTLYAYVTTNPTNAISCSYTVDCIDYTNYNGVYYNNNYTNYSGSSGTIYYYDPYTGSYTTSTSGTSYYYPSYTYLYGDVDTSGMSGLTQQEMQQLINEWIADSYIPDDTEIYNYSYYYPSYSYSYPEERGDFIWESYFDEYGVAADSSYSPTYSYSYVDSDGDTVFSGVDYSCFAGLSASEIDDLIDEWVFSESIPD